MALVRRKKGATLAKVPIRFKPSKTQLSEVDSLGRAWGKDRPDVVRELLDEALKARRLKTVGKDEATDAVVEAQKRAMAEALAPLTSQVASLAGSVERIEGRMIDEFEHLSGGLKFVILALRFVVVEVMVCRILLRDYVHTAYKVFVGSVGKPVADIEKNFNVRLKKFREEAGTALDELTEASVSGLSSMAERTDVFDEESPRPAARPGK